MSSLNAKATHIFSKNINVYAVFANAKATRKTVSVYAIFNDQSFSKNISVYSIFNDQSFNDTVSNDIIHVLNNWALDFFDQLHRTVKINYQCEVVPLVLLDLLIHRFMVNGYIFRGGNYQNGLSLF